MTTTAYLVKNKLGLTQLVSYLQNVSKACRVTVYSPNTCYPPKDSYPKGGMGLLEGKMESKPDTSETVTVDEGMEKAAVAIAFENPALGQKMASKALRQRGIAISPTGVRRVWLRHNLETRQKRLMALERQVAETGKAPAETPPKVREEKVGPNQTKAEHVGYLCAQDIFYVSTLKGVGRIYQQTFVDTYSGLAFAKLYTSKHPINSAAFLNDRVLPFFDQYQIPILQIITDRGAEFCGKSDSHEYELFLQLYDIDHLKTKINNPQSNIICEAFHKMLIEEFYHDAFKKNSYLKLEELQRALDDWINNINMNRVRHEKFFQKKTPMEMFLSNVSSAKKKVLNLNEDKLNAAA